jgi:hypothetical protein
MAYRWFSRLSGEPTTVGISTPCSTEMAPVFLIPCGQTSHVLRIINRHPNRSHDV